MTSFCANLSCYLLQHICEKLCCVTKRNPPLPVNHWPWPMCITHCSFFITLLSFLEKESTSQLTETKKGGNDFILYTEYYIPHLHSQCCIHSTALLSAWFGLVEVDSFSLKAAFTIMHFSQFLLFPWYRILKISIKKIIISRCGKKERLQLTINR